MLSDDYVCEGQMSVFDWINREKMPLKITKPLRLIEMFSGIGSQVASLKEVGANLDGGNAYRICDVDKYAVKSYNAINGTNFVPQDITKLQGKDLGIVDKDKYTYLLFYSFPCTDLSQAGRMCGMSYKDWKEGKSTRSGLLWEVMRLLEETEQLPDILVLENVPQIHSTKNMPDFELWLKYLETRGYTTVWQDMNAKDYGIPQSRNRTIAVSWLGDYTFKFPQPIPLDKEMADLLEEGRVAENHYFHTEKAHLMVDKLVKSGKLPTRRDETRRDETRRDETRHCIDFTTNNPRCITIANCIAARTDRGISGHKQEGSGVVECTRLGRMHIE